MYLLIWFFLGKIWSYHGWVHTSAEFWGFLRVLSEFYCHHAVFWLYTFCFKPVNMFFHPFSYVRCFGWDNTYGNPSSLFTNFWLFWSRIHNSKQRLVSSLYPNHVYLEKKKIELKDLKSKCWTLSAYISSFGNLFKKC